MERFDALVVGGSVAGLSAALMLGRARRRTLVIDDGAPRNRFASAMHGVLGHDGVAPADLVARGAEEVARYGVERTAGRVLRVDEDGDDLVAHLGDGRAIRARAVLLATGVRDDLPPIPGLRERWGTSVLHCPYCHGWEVRDRTIGVLATSPASVHQLELVRQWSDDVVAFVHGLGEVEPELRARLDARGIRVVEAEVVEVLGEGDAIDVLRTADGSSTRVDAIFTGGALVPLDDVVAHLGLDRVDGPTGSVLAVGPLGATSHPRIFAAGNVVVPHGNVPLSMGQGSMTGAGVNAMLVGLDAAAALAAPERHRHLAPETAPEAFWEDLYRTRRRWSGAPNATVVDVAGELPVGRALDLGAGEGGDVLWLAERGWDATGVDISETAVARATRAAAKAGLDERARFEVADLATRPADDAGHDLVVASFLQSPVALDRGAIVRTHAERVPVGGHVLVVAHAGVPSWADAAAHDELPTPDEIVAELALDGWATELAEVRQRAVTAPDGAPATLDDAVVLLRRES